MQKAAVHSEIDNSFMQLQKSTIALIQAAQVLTERQSYDQFFHIYSFVVSYEFLMFFGNRDVLKATKQLVASLKKNSGALSPRGGI